MISFRLVGAQVAVAGLVVALAACSSNDSTTGDGTSASSGTSATAVDTAAAALVPDEIRQRGYVTIATDPTYPPLEYTDADSGDLEGMEVELGNELSAALGLQVHWQNVAFDSIVPGLQAGRYDLSLSGFWVFPDRVKVASMITYFESGSQYMVKAGSDLKVDARSDLCGTTVALESGSSEIQMDQDENAQCKSQGKQDITIQTYQTQNQANLAVTSGRAQSTGVGAEVAGYTVQNSNDQLALAGGIFDSSPAGVAFAKNSPLLQAYYAAFRTLDANGDLKALFAKYGIGDQQIALKLNQ